MYVTAYLIQDPIEKLLHRQSEQLEARLKEQGEQLEEQSKQLEARLKEQSEQFEEKFKQISECHKVTALYTSSLWVCG